MNLGFAADNPDARLVVVDINETTPLAQQAPMGQANGTMPHTSAVCSPANCSSGHLVAVASSAILGVWAWNPTSTKASVDASVLAYDNSDPGCLQNMSDQALAEISPAAAAGPVTDESSSDLAGIATMRSVRAVANRGLLPGLELSYASSEPGSWGFQLLQQDGLGRNDLVFSGAACATSRFTSSTAYNQLAFNDDRPSHGLYVSCSGWNCSSQMTTSFDALDGVSHVVASLSQWSGNPSTMQLIVRGHTDPVCQAQPSARSQAPSPGDSMDAVSTNWAHLPPTQGLVHSYRFEVMASDTGRYLCQGITNTTKMKAGMAAWPNITTDATLYLISGLNASQIYFLMLTVPSVAAASVGQLNIIHTAMANPLGAIAGAVIGALIAISALLALILAYVIRKRRQAAGSFRGSGRPISPWTPGHEAQIAPIWGLLLGGSAGQTGSKRQNLQSDQPSADTRSDSIDTGSSVLSVGSLQEGLQVPQPRQAVGKVAFADLKDKLLSSPLETAPPASIGVASHHLPSSDAAIYQSAPSAGLLKVYKGNLGGFCPVAVKVVDSRDSRQQKLFVQEIATLRACHSPHIIMFLGASIQENSTVLVMQYMPNGNLWHALANDVKKRFSWYNRGHRVALDIAAGISYLHSKKIIHLDLKTPNILLDEHNKAYVADIGLGKLLTEGAEAVAYAASLFWAAPEQLQRLPCNEASDVYSFGIILWEICTGEQPVNRIMRAVRIPEECPQQVADMIQACRHADASRRPPITAVFKALQSTTHLGDDA
ncbi:hypothetical protein WJX74_008928 [Apatococcus lobatus]|uniref:Protein kinase domain-containing protein n=1 Tax=Apatococcus lobatus TaxID=904363 RepID=A0AAW1SCW1_9CHLO